MKVTYSVLLAFQAISAIAAPSPKKAVAAEEAVSGLVTATAALTTATAVASTTAAASATAAPAAGGGGGAGAEEENKENEVEQQAQFGAVVNIGANIKTDTLFPPGKVGLFEVEIQNARPRLLRVTENKTPAAAPIGFTNPEGVSWRVEIGGGGSRGFALSKIDYIRNANSNVDISTGQIGRLCRETNSFVIGAGVGELEFEVEENELTLTVDNLVGEWAVFLPNAAAGAGAGAGTGAVAISEEQALAALPGCQSGSLCRSILDLMMGANKAGSAAK